MSGLVEDQDTLRHAVKKRLLLGLFPGGFLLVLSLRDSCRLLFPDLLRQRALVAAPPPKVQGNRARQNDCKQDIRHVSGGRLRSDQAERGAALLAALNHSSIK